ncbi:MAG: hypothetical protein DHS20C18_37640 [Saprospiraceae bacterium]|nr:MAG: hypothetical protein DHS20C18_37640 [Saprospiraceae bacterium]
MAIFLPVYLTAQENAEEKWGYMYLNVNFQVGIPMEAFNDYLDVPGVGGGGLFLLPIKRELPLTFGAEFSAMTYASESQNFTSTIGGFTRDFRFTTSNNIFLGHVVVRIQPPVNSVFRPYLDGMVGFKNLYTRNRLEETFNDGGDEIDESKTVKGDWAFSYGGAVGLQLAVFRNKGIMIDLRCAYLPGSNASYLVRKDNVNFDFNNPLDSFDERKSPTTILLPQIGITFDINFNAPEEEMPYDD